MIRGLLVLTFALLSSIHPSALAQEAKQAPKLNCMNLVAGALSDDVWTSTLRRILDTHDLRSELLRIEPPKVKQHSWTMAQKRVVNQAIRFQLRSTPEVLTDVRSLIYPASGFDSSTPFQIIEDLRLVIGIDDHTFFSRPIGAAVEPDVGPEDHSEPFLPPGSNQVVHQNQGFTHYTRADSVRSFADVIVGRILDLSPNVRIREVRGFFPAHFREQSRWNEMPHGLVVFDFGEGTPVRTYVHLQVETSRSKGERATSPAGHAILERLSELDFDALLAKGSQGFFAPSESNKAARALVSALVQRNGLWLDGNGAAMTSVSFSPTGIRNLLSTWRLESSSCPLIRTNIRGFGYGQFEYCRFGP